MKKILLLIILLGNCVSNSVKDEISFGEDMVCEEERVEDCKYRFENY